jgi:hypothetical protein
MPFVRSYVNVPVSKEQELSLKAGLGKAIELIPGKSEEYLVTVFNDESHMYARGDGSRPAAYIEAAIWGNEIHAGYDEFTATVCALYHQVLNIPEENIFIRYEDIPDWGVGRYNFDRNRY